MPQRPAACGGIAKLTLVTSCALSLRKERTRWLVSLVAFGGNRSATGRQASSRLAVRVRAVCPLCARALLEVKAVLLLAAAPALGVGALVALTLDTCSRFLQSLSLSIRSPMQRIKKSYDLLGSSSRQRSYVSMSYRKRWQLLTWQSKMSFLFFSGPFSVKPR